MRRRPTRSRRDTRPRRTGSAACLAAVLLLAALVATAHPSGASPTVDYIYANANEGGASGGHVAIGFGDEVFHFEYRAPGLVHLRRDHFEQLRHRYTVLDNRTLVIHRIAVSDETHRLLRDEFARRRIVQDQDLWTQASLAGERRLLSALRARRSGGVPEEPVVVDGAGLFLDAVAIPDIMPQPPGDGSAAAIPGPAAEALVTLRERVDATHGSGFVDEAVRRTLGELLDLTPEAHDGGAPRRDVSGETSATAASGFARRYQDLLTSLVALRVLRDARPLRPGALIGAGGEGPTLDRNDAELVERLMDDLESSLVRLVQSSRTDPGFPLLVGMARLLALDESHRIGRWMFLDAFAPDAATVPPQQITGPSAVTEALRGEARADFADALNRARRSAGRATFAEADFADLEAAGNRLIEIDAAIEARRPMRLASGLHVPSRDAVVPDLPVPAVAGDELARLEARAREREEAHERELQRRYGYDLATRNCVTEIFRTIDAALATTLPGADPGAVRRESIRRLGGHVDVEHTLDFIPAVSAHTVRVTYAVAETVEIPSFRLAALARLYRRDSAVRVYARESNTLTSTLYARNPADSAFLFFTDDVVLARPLLGAANVVAGLGVSAAGLLTMPVDRGRLLHAGLKGVFFSVPELVFLNIRKGSLPFAPRGRW